MNKIFDCANSYIHERSWIMLALVKFCLCAIGLMLGLLLPEKWRKAAFISAAAVFVLTYVPLMADFFGFAKKYYTQNI